MESAADDSGVKDISKSIQAAANPAKFGVDKLKSAASSTFKPGTETAKLSEERQAAKDKISAATARAAQDRRDREMAAADAAEMSDEPDMAMPAPVIEPAPAPKPKAVPKAKAAASTMSDKPAKPRAKKTPAGEA